MLNTWAKNCVEYSRLYFQLKYNYFSFGGVLGKNMPMAVTTREMQIKTSVRSLEIPRLMYSLPSSVNVPPTQF